MRQNFLLLFIGFVLTINLFSQPGDNPKVAWKEATYTRFSLIHAPEMHDKANRIGDILHSIQYHGTQTLGHSYNDIPILLQHYNADFNGFVSIAPFQSEFYGMAPPNNSILGSSDWLDILTIHEYRHVIQFSQAKRSKAVQLSSILFGGFGWASSTGLVLPNWFIEGDATWFETATTRNGRGRLAYFHNLNTAIALDGQPLRFNTALNASFLRPVPNRYQLGYILNRYVYEKYGTVWHDILKEATSYKGILFPFRSAVKRHTGKPLKTIYQEAMLDYQERVAQVDYRFPSAYQQPLHKTRRSGRTNFHSPMMYEGTLYAIQEGWDHEPRLISLQEGKVKSIFGVGLNTNYTFDIQNNWVLWSEQVPDIRRSNVQWHAIFFKNLKDGRTTSIKHETQYFSPTFNHDATKIVATEQDSGLHFYLVELQPDGAILSRQQGPNGGQLLFPWYQNDSTIVAIEKTEGEQRIYRVHTQTQDWELLMAPTRISMHYARLQDSLYLFSAAFDDKDEVYGLHLNSLTLHKLASSKVGLYYPFLDSTGLYASDFTRTGFQLVRVDSSLLQENLVSDTKLNFDTSSIYHSSSFDYARQVLDSLPHNEPHSTGNYNQLKHSVNVYGWSPYTTFTRTGLQVYSENLLGNTFISADYAYDFEVNQHSFKVGATYATLYPIFNGSFSLNSDADFEYLQVQGDTSVLIRNAALPRMEQSLEVQFPFNLAKNSKVSHSANLFASLGFQQFNQIEQPFNQATLGIRANWQLTSLRRYRMLNPRFGIIFQGLYNQSITNDNTYSFASINTLLPGLLRTHSLMLGAEYFRQQQDLSQPFRFRRFHGGDYLVGITDGFKETNLLAVYRMPLLYPNFGLGQLLFFPRIRANLIGGYSQIDYDLLQRDVYTLAGDIIFETSFMDNFDISFGMRYGVYKVDNQDWEPEMNFFLNIPLLNGLLLKPPSVFQAF